MKRKWIRLVGMGLGAAVAMLGIAGAAHAQERVMANIPFDFTAGGVRLPAGSYSIAETPIQGILLLQDAERRHAAFVLTIPAGSDKASDPKLVFERTGSTYALVRVDEGGFEAREVPIPAGAKGRERERVAVLLTPRVTAR